RRLSTDSLVLALLVVSVVSVAGYFTIEPVFTLIGAKGEVLSLIRRYMQIWYISMPFLVMPMVASALLRSTGDAVTPSAIMSGAAVANVVLTPMFMFGAGPIPAMSIEGAAIGSLVARAMTFVATLYFVVKRERLITLRPPKLSEALQSWKEVAGVGVPASAGNMISPISVGVVVGLLAVLGDEVVAAFGVATRIEAFACIPLLALSSAIGPVTGQSFGAGDIARVRGALRVSFLFSLAWAVVLVVTFWSAGELIAATFTDDPAVIGRAQRYLTFVAPSLWGYGFVIIGAAAFNGIGRARLGLAYYAIRAMVFYVPAAYVASRFGSSDAVFIGLSLSNAGAGITVAIVVWRQVRRLKPERS
ncbi:MAG: MATE family efflux transporter, partial [Myxococcota bacterium]